MRPKRLLSSVVDMLIRKINDRIENTIKHEKENKKRNKYFKETNILHIFTLTASEAEHVPDEAGVGSP